MRSADSGKSRPRKETSEQGGASGQGERGPDLTREEAMRAQGSSRLEPQRPIKIEPKRAPRYTEVEVEGPRRSLFKTLRDKMKKKESSAVESTLSRQAFNQAIDRAEPLNHPLDNQAQRMLNVPNTSRSGTSQSTDTSGGVMKEPLASAERLERARLRARREQGYDTEEERPPTS
jgi:hypothetical protein